MLLLHHGTVLVPLKWDQGPQSAWFFIGAVLVFYSDFLVEEPVRGNILSFAILSLYSLLSL